MERSIADFKIDNLTNRLMNTGNDPVRENVIRMIIHEIRNPLSAIKLANQLMAKEQVVLREDANETQKLTTIIERNIERIETQLKQLLTGDENSEPAYKRIDLGAILQNVLERAEDRIFLKKTIVHKLYQGTFFVVGNEYKLSLAFLNLLVNAIEAMEPGKGELWISINDKRDEIEMIVRDNGEGMDPATAAHIFDAHYSTKREGLGMGLTHAKSILDAHDALIRLNTAPGKGTSFSVTFKK